MVDNYSKEYILLMHKVENQERNNGKAINFSPPTIKTF